MGADLAESSPLFRSLVSIGAEMLGIDLMHVCLRGPARELGQASRVQALLSAVSLGYWRVLADSGVRPTVVLGHSLGEITSLTAAGVVSPEDCVRMATFRGQLMDRVAEQTPGGMLAALFVPMEAVEGILHELNAPDRIVLANDNGPDQVVLSGDDDILERFAAMVAERQLGRTRRLEVAGPWHSHYMTEARHDFEAWAEPIEFHTPEVPLILNALAREEQHPLAIKHLVTYQLTSPVYWRESMNRLKQMGITAIVEIGPGRVLSGLGRVNGCAKGVDVFNASNLRGVEQAVAALA